MPNMKLSLDYRQGNLNFEDGCYHQYFLLQVDTDHGTFWLRVSEHQHRELDRNYPGGARGFFTDLANHKS